MKITVKVSELKKKMDRALGVIPSKATIPVLANVKIEVLSANQALISGSDLGMSMIQSVEIALVSDQAGALLLPVKTVADILAPLVSDAQVVIETEGETITLKCAKLKVKLPGTPLAQFPAIEPKPETQFHIKTSALKEIIARVEYAAPAKGGRQSVPSVLLESNDTTLQAVATDGFRIAIAKVAGAGAGTFSIQLPKTLLGLLKELPGEAIAFAESENNFFFVGDGEQILIRKPNTKFPPYQRVLVQEYTTEATLPVPSLSTLLAEITPVLDKDNPAVNVTVAGGELTMYGSSSLVGEAEDSVPVTVDPTLAADNKVRLNPRFIQDFLGQAEGKVTVSLLAANKLVKFSNEKNDYLYFVMPMQEPND